MVRRQAALGSELRRMYGEGKRMDIITLGRVIKVNYRYNTVDVQLKDNAVVINSGSGDGRFSAPIPVEFAGVTPEGKPFGQIQPIAVGTTVLIGFEDKHSNRPVVLAVYADPEETYELSRAPFNSTEPNNTSVRKHMNNKFTVYPNLTYENIDGVGNRTVSFNGKSFVTFDSDGTSQASGLSDEGTGTGYENLSTSYYYSGELIEPINSKAPAILFKHQGDRNTLEGSVKDEHNFMVFLSQDGNYRTSIMRNDEDWRSYYELTPKGDFVVKYQRDTKSLKTSDDFVQFSVGGRGIEMRSGDKYFLFNEDGVSGNVGVGTGTVEEINRIGTKLDGLDEMIVRMGTEFTQSSEEIRSRAYLDTLLEDSIRSYQATLSIMAQQIYAGVKTTEISGPVAAGLENLAKQVERMANRNKENLTEIEDFIEDGIIDALEKIVINDLWTGIQAEHKGLTRQADEVGFSPAMYTPYYIALNTYVTPLLTSLDSSTPISRVTFRQIFVEFFNARLNLVQNIYDEVKTGVDAATQKVVGAAGASGESLMKMSMATMDAEAMITLIQGIVGDDKIDPQEKEKLLPRYQNLINDASEAVELAFLYGVSTIQLTNTVNTLETNMTTAFSHMRETTNINGVVIVKSFQAYYEQYINLHKEITKQTQIILDNYSGDVTDYSSQILQTSGVIANVVDAVEILGSQVRTSRAYTELRANRYMVTLSGSSYDRSAEAVQNTAASGGTNLYAIASSSEGSVNPDTGELTTTDKNARTSEYITVPPTEDFVLSVFDNTELNKLIVAYYDDLKEFITSDTVADTTSIIRLPITTPANAKYVIVSADHLDSVRMQFEIGTVGTLYKPSHRDSVQDIELAQSFYDQSKSVESMKINWKTTMSTQAEQGKSKVAAISADMVASPGDKLELKDLQSLIIASHDTTISEATINSLGTSNIIGAYETLNSYLDTILEDMSVTTELSSSLKGFFDTYYEERDYIATEVTDRAIQTAIFATTALADATQASLDAETNRDNLVDALQEAAQSVEELSELKSREVAYHTTVLTDITDTSIDGVLDPDEKDLITVYIGNAEVDFDTLPTKANVHSLSLSRYTQTYNSLVSYTKPLISQDTWDNPINISHSSFVSHFTNYFSAKEDLLSNMLLSAQAVESTSDLMLADVNEQLGPKGRSAGLKQLDEQQTIIPSEVFRMANDTTGANLWNLDVYPGIDAYIPEMKHIRFIDPIRMEAIADNTDLSTYLTEEDKVYHLHTNLEVPDRTTIPLIFDHKDGLTISVNGGAPIYQTGTAGDNRELNIPLVQGWNSIDILIRSYVGGAYITSREKLSSFVNKMSAFLDAGVAVSRFVMLNDEVSYQVVYGGSSAGVVVSNDSIGGAVVSIEGTAKFKGPLQANDGGTTLDLNNNRLEITDTFDIVGNTNSRIQVDGDAGTISFDSGDGTSRVTIGNGELRFNKQGAEAIAITTSGMSGSKGSFRSGTHLGDHFLGPLSSNNNHLVLRYDPEGT